MLGGALTSFALAFLLKAISEARAGATAAISSTVMGALWIGGGLGFLILLRHLPTHGRSRSTPSCSRSGPATRSRTSAAACSAATRWRPSTSPGKTWEGFVFGTAATVVRRVRRAVQAADFLSIPQSIVLGVILAFAGPLGRPLRVAAEARRGREGQRQPARRPRRHARPARRVPLRGAGGLLRDPRVHDLAGTLSP